MTTVLQNEKEERHHQCLDMAAHRCASTTFGPVEVPAESVGHLTWGVADHDDLGVEKLKLDSNTVNLDPCYQQKFAWLRITSEKIKMPLEQHNAKGTRTILLGMELGP